MTFHSLGLQHRFHSKYECGEPDQCWPWTAGTKKGYGVIRAKRSGQSARTEPRLAHWIAYELANGPIPPGARVNHTCGTRACVNPEHLRIGTHLDSVRYRIHRRKKGQLALTDGEVRALRHLARSGKWTLVQLARVYGVSYQAVHSYRTGHRRAYV